MCSCCLCSPMFISILTEDIGPRHLCKPSLGSREWMQSSSTSFGNFKLNYGDFVSAKKDFCVLEQIISLVMSDHNSIDRILLFTSFAYEGKNVAHILFPTQGLTSTLYVQSVVNCFILYMEKRGHNQCWQVLQFGVFNLRSSRHCDLLNFNWCPFGEIDTRIVLWN
jgi:hypothetical protein